MRKLFLLLVVVATFSFAACTNTQTTEQPEEATVESAQQALEEASDKIDSAQQIVEEVVDSLATTVN